MIKRQTNLNTRIRHGAIGLALLTGATIAQANDSDRITSLEKEVQELKLRLANLEGSQATGSRPKIVASKDGWKSLENWRSVSKGMSPDAVRSVLGEPMTVRASGAFTDWSYSNQGSVTFHEEKLYGWREPR
ncbi:MAG: hypothetical protein FGM21_15005 [Limnohabitans sp.]|nr:hypothetical protein [Limnohabitans sp.]